ncbi:MAG: hypothetical protein LAO31_19730 [Acidobacteriia bacterium]|nr:hypothetical protein [Terriglobia bacterium]
MKRMTVIISLSFMLVFFTVLLYAQFTDWSSPVNLGAPVNSSAFETCVSVSKNGLSLYFGRSPNGSALFDLYVSKRASIDEPWGEPELVPNVNSSSNEFCPALSLDEHRLYFASNRPGGCGLLDIYVSRRHDRRDDFGWGPPENIGCQVNSPGRDQTPYFFEDETGAEVMYFGSNRAGSFDIYETRMRDDDTFGPVTPVAELNTEFDELGPAVRRDGLEIVFDSTRPDGLGQRDVWTATRESSSAPWSVPVNLTILNGPFFDGGRMSFSFDGRMLYFSSVRDGGEGQSDIYVTTREKLRGNNKDK